MWCSKCGGTDHYAARCTEDVVVNRPKVVVNAESMVVNKVVNRSGDRHSKTEARREYMRAYMRARRANG